MSRIRSRDTQPELLVRSLLHRLGYRFYMNLLFFGFNLCLIQPGETFRFFTRNPILRDAELGILIGVGFSKEQ